MATVTKFWETFEYDGDNVKHYKNSEGEEWTAEYTNGHMTKKVQVNGCTENWTYSGDKVTRYERTYDSTGDLGFFGPNKHLN